MGSKNLPDVVSRFEITYAHIRYNPRDQEDVAVQITEGATTFHGILTLMGWTPDAARIDSCFLERDTTLEPGTMVIAPMEA